MPNAEWTLVEHPRFGLIRGIRAIENIEQASLKLSNFIDDLTLNNHFQNPRTQRSSSITK